MLISAIAAASFAIVPALLIVGIPLTILLRGTLAKRSLEKQRHRKEIALLLLAIPFLSDRPTLILHLGAILLHSLPMTMDRDPV